MPDRSLVAARQDAEAAMTSQIAAESIESFVGHNIEELSPFSQDKLID